MTNPHAKHGDASEDGLVQGNASWGAPGHNSVLVYKDKIYNLYHALQGGRGAATLRIAEIVWDVDGWPVTAGP